MIRIDNYEICKAHLSDLRALFMDDSNASDVQFMTDSRRLAVDFDAVKTEYVNRLGLSEARFIYELRKSAGLTQKELALF